VQLREGLLFCIIQSLRGVCISVRVGSYIHIYTHMHMYVVFFASTRVPRRPVCPADTDTQTHTLSSTVVLNGVLAQIQHHNFSHVLASGLCLSLLLPHPFRSALGRASCHGLHLALGSLPGPPRPPAPVAVPFLPPPSSGRIWRGSNITRNSPAPR